MDKSIYRREYKAMLELLRTARLDAGFTQDQLAERLDEPQSFVSKVEHGDRRVDLVELHTILAVLGQSLQDFVRRYEREVARLR